MRRSDWPAGHRPVRTIAWLVGAVLLFGGTVWAELPEKDPVEKFRQALLLETNKGISYSNQLKGETLEKALSFRKKNLEEAAANLTSLSDLSRALLLVDWPEVDNKEKRQKDPENFEKGSRYIVTDLREAMAKRFNKGIEKILESPRSSSAAKVAVANLVGETIVKASDQGYTNQVADKRAIGKADNLPGKGPLVFDIDSKGFAEKLAKMTNESDERVGVAVAGALGQFREQPKVVGPALKRLLGTTQAESTRLAAASALVNLSSSISNKVSLKGSEPGVTIAEPRRFRRDLEPEDILEIVKQVTDGASVGLSDSSVAVRRQCIAAMRNVAWELPRAIRTPFTDRPLPPRERASRSPEESANIKAERADLEKSLEPVLLALADYDKNYTSVLARAVRDQDETVRVDARKTLRELARVQQSINELRSAIPEDVNPKDAKPKIDPNDLSRRQPAKGVNVQPASGTKVATGTAIPVSTPVLTRGRLKQAPAGKADGITGLLSEIGRGLVADGVRDPSAKVRQAAHEAIEALGDDGAKYLPELAKSLEDEDLFVRWITARILRKLAEENERRNREHQSTDLIIPALLKGLDDEDLDGRIAVTRTLGAYGVAAKSAVPALAKLVGKGDAEYRIVVLKALAGIGDESQTALPDAVAAFKSTDPRVRAEAARLVGQLHKFASSYVGDLEKLANDPDPKVREVAGAAILRIQPE